MASTTEGVDDPNRGRAGTHGLSRIVNPWTEALIFWSAIPIPCGTGCAEVNGAPAGHSRVQEVSPNSAWRSRCIACSCRSCRADGLSYLTCSAE